MEDVKNMSAWGVVGSMLGGVWAYQTLKPFFNKERFKKDYRKIKKKLKTY